MQNTQCCAVDIKLPNLAFQFIIKFCAECIYMAK